MKRSIRTFLIVNILLCVTLIISLVIIGNFYLEHKDFHQHLDNNLIYSALSLQLFVTENHAMISPQKLQADINKEEKLLLTNQAATEHMQFQVLNRQHHIMVHSANAPVQILCSDKMGFSDCLINHQLWRVFVSMDADTGDTIVVGERYSVRNQFALRATRDLILILLMSYPFLGILIWYIIGRGLKSIQKVANEVSYRAAANLQTVDLENVPAEIKSLVDELNELFIRLQAAFQREKRFAADAAHELKTPLAALKTQTQVAINTTKEEERNAAFNNILACVDRSTHTVQQLLVLSRMVPDAMVEGAKTIALNNVAAEVIASLVPEARKKKIEIELISPNKPQTITGNAIAINILLRNLIDNAIRYTPEKGSVKIIIASDTDHVFLHVIDTGPGIPEKLRKRVFERFFRVLGNNETGSGLGFSIVQQIVNLHNAQMELLTPASGKGLEIKVTFQKS
ncbi:MAG: two-component sensor histidine kinase, partial [Gammaproteobacteria bacterium]|nr:two-component sensor histidine kinase [Gammaproteobacteria bacterium]